MTKFDLLEFADLFPPSPAQPRRNLKVGELAKVMAALPPEHAADERTLILVEIVECLPNGYLAIVNDGPEWLPVDTRIVATFQTISTGLYDGGAGDLLRADDEDDE